MEMTKEEKIELIKTDRTFTIKHIDFSTLGEIVLIITTGEDFYYNVKTNCFFLKDFPIVYLENNSLLVKYLLSEINSYTERTKKILDKVAEVFQIKEKPYSPFTLLTSTKQPFICPVCNGNGLVPNGFYNQTSGNWSTSSITPEPCRSCSQMGVLWS